MLTFCKLKTVTLISLSFILGGCVSRSVQMVNDSGQAANCGSAGLGLIGAPVAYAMTEDCINKYKVAGYREAGSPPISSVTPNTAPIAAQSPSTFTSKDESFKISLYSGWIPLSLPNQSPQLSLKNIANDTYLIVNSNNLSDVSDWTLFAENAKAKFVNNLTDSSTTPYEKLKIGEFDALRAEIGGTLKNGLKVRYLNTVLKTDKKIIYFVSWTTESRFPLVKNELSNIPYGLKFY